MASFRVPAIFSAIDRVTAPLKRMRGAVTRLELRLKSAGKSINRSLGGLGGALTGAAIFTVLSAGIQTVAKYEQANANLASVMGLTVNQTRALQKDSVRLGATTAKSATEVVALQEAYARLGFKQKEILNVTEATINGSIAMQGALDQTAELTGAVIRTFDNFGTSDATTVIDQMTLATQKSALNFEKLQTALPIVAGAANEAGVGFDQLLALLGKLSDAGIDASSSSTALRNIFIESAAQGLSFQKILAKIEKEQDKLTASNDEFGKRAAVSASILSNNISKTEQLTAVLSQASQGQSKSGVAAATAQKQLDTLTGSTTLLKSAYEGFILSLDNGQGSLSTSLRFVVDLGTAVLGLLTATEKSTGATDDSKESVEEYKNRVQAAASNVMKLGKFVGVLIGGYVALKAILIATTAAQTAYSVIQGIAAFRTGVGTAAIAGNAIAMKAHLILTKGQVIATNAAAAAQAIFNAIMTANPIGLIIAAIAALIAFVALAIENYDTWGKTVLAFTGPLGMVIELIMEFKRNWQSVVDAFKDGGIIAGLNRVGEVLLSAIISPFQTILETIAKIPGLGLAGGLASSLEKFRSNTLGVDTGNAVASSVDDKTQPAINRSVEVEEKRNIQEQTSRNELRLLISDPNNNVAGIDQSGAEAIPVVTEPSFNF